MRARIMLFSGDEQARRLALEAQEVLTDLALAFGHSLTIREEKMGALSEAAYGSAMTEEAVRASGDCDAVLCTASSSEGLDALAEGLQCDAVCHVYDLPESLSARALLKGDILPRGLICAPLEMHEAGVRAAGKLAYRLANEQKLDILEVPPQGRLRGLWDEAAGYSRLNLPTINWRQLTLPDAIGALISAPQHLGVLLASPLAADSLARLTAGLSGLGSLLHSRYCRGEKPVIFSVTQTGHQQEGGGPFGLLMAMADLLGRGLSLQREAQALTTCVRNVLEAGWRTGDIALPGEARVDAAAVCRLIREQIALVAELMPGT